MRHGREIHSEGEGGMFIDDDDDDDDETKEMKLWVRSDKRGSSDVLVKGEGLT